MEWLHTIDKRYIDPDGFSCITRHIKDMTIRRGKSIALLEIDWHLMAHKATDHGSIIGAPNKTYDEVITAFVKYFGHRLVPTNEELRAWIRDTLVKFKQPKYSY